jgi:prefoldin subunit 5|tara:strand:+ start:1050 stop:1196 length:147 start_codon:yes stop_codon:yes gene_type:complete
MDKYEVENAIKSLSKAIEDISYRLYALEESLATANAYIEEHKEERIDA